MFTRIRLRSKVSVLRMTPEPERAPVFCWGVRYRYQLCLHESTHIELNVRKSSITSCACADGLTSGYATNTVPSAPTRYEMRLASGIKARPAPTAFASSWSRSLSRRNGRAFFSANFLFFSGESYETPRTSMPSFWSSFQLSRSWFASSVQPGVRAFG